MTSMSAVITKYGVLYCQVCVPNAWTDIEVKSFADKNNPAGTEHGWSIRKEGHELLGGDSERQPCSDRAGFVHIMLEC